jgi:hypothetical protein
MNTNSNHANNWLPVVPDHYEESLFFYIGGMVDIISALDTGAAG